MQSKKVMPWLVLALFMVVGSFFPRNVFAIGVAPGSTIVENAANGVRISKTLRVTRPEDTGILNFKVEVSGSGARYIELSSPVVTIPNGARYIDYPLVIAPVNAANGSYRAAVQFLSQESLTTSTSQFAIAAYEGVSAEVLFTVTGQQVSSYTVGALAAERIEATTAPTFTYMLKNDGNVDAQPDRVDFSITNSSGTVQLAETFTSSSLPVVKPGEENTISLSLKNKLPPGVYFVDATFLDKGKTLYERKKIRLEILPEGTLQQDGEVTSFEVSEDKVPVAALVKGTAIFNNIGDVGVRPVLYVSIKKDGRTIDILRSEERFVGAKRSGIFSIEFRPDSVGQYVLEAYFSYGIKETKRLEKIVFVQDFSSALHLPNFSKISPWLFACTPRFTSLIFLIIIIVETIMLLRYMRRWRIHELCQCSLPCMCHGGYKKTDEAYQRTAVMSSESFSRSPHNEPTVATVEHPYVSDLPSSKKDDNDPFEEIMR